ncbi:hypothetical protein ACO0LD_18890 [Undibacterium sp. Ji83W]|uniref:hypothetical protein n=1 Tax=Undibacterium sp. Ji83W TaxID=3413043 RepID=UPI003BF3261F
MRFFSIFKQHPYLLLLWAGITWLCSVEHAGMLSWVILPVVLVYACIRYASHLENDVVMKKAVLLMRLSLLSFAIATLIQNHHNASAREYRDMVVTVLKDYEKTHGQLPPSLDDIPALASDGPRPHLLRYYRNKDGALLFYSSSFSHLKRMKYDFSNQTWKSIPD